MRLNVSGSTTDLMLDYMTPLVASLTKPLVHREAEGVGDVIKVLDDYDLLKEDMDNILELDTWPGKADPMAGIASKVRRWRGERKRKNRLEKGDISTNLMTFFFFQLD